MRQQLLHTPEGVRDIYNGECEKKMVLRVRTQGAMLLVYFAYICVHFLYACVGSSLIWMHF